MLSPAQWSATVAVVMVGTLLGAGGYTFVAAKGASYLSNDPQVCVACHIMREEYDGWRHGSHHEVPSAMTVTSRTRGSSPSST